MGAAGAAPAQAGLCGLAADRSLTPRVREEAIGALVLIKRPTAPTLLAVARLLDERAATVRRTARAVAGTVARFGRQEHVAEWPRSSGRCSPNTRGPIAVTIGFRRWRPWPTWAARRCWRRSSPRWPTAITRCARPRRARCVWSPIPPPIACCWACCAAIGIPTVRAAAIFAAGFRELGPLIDGLAETASPIRWSRCAPTRSPYLLARYANLSPRVTRALAYAADNDPKSNLRQLARDALDSRR